VSEEIAFSEVIEEQWLLSGWFDNLRDGRIQFVELLSPMNRHLDESLVNNATKLK